MTMKTTMASRSLVESKRFSDMPFERHIAAQFVLIASSVR
jgi:hypothetical protein